MKRLIIILVTGIFCCNIVIAKELKTRFGFNINLPDNYVPDIRLKIDFYRRLARISDTAELETYQ